MPDVKLEDDAWIDVDNAESVECTYKPVSKPLETRLVKLYPLNIKDGRRDD